jgi:hypothetical protein
VRESASHAAHRARAELERGRDKIGEVSQEYPLAVGVGCAALGLIAGLLLMRTRAEDQRLGLRSEEFRSKVRRAGSNWVERAKDFASEIGQAARGEMRRQELTPEQVADDAGRTASQTARQEGLTTDELGRKVERVAERVSEAVRREVDEAKSKF